MDWDDDPEEPPYQPELNGLIPNTWNAITVPPWLFDQPEVKEPWSLDKLVRHIKAKVEYLRLMRRIKRSH